MAVGVSEKEKFWRFVVSEQSASGLSIVEFCRLEGVSQPSFYAWRKKIRERDGQTNQAAVHRCQLLPVKVVDSLPGPQPQTAGLSAAKENRVSDADTESRLEIVTPQGLRVVVGESCSAELIRKTIDSILKLDVDRLEASSC